MSVAVEVATRHEQCRVGTDNRKEQWIGEADGTWCTVLRYV